MNPKNFSTILHTQVNYHSNEYSLTSLLKPDYHSFFKHSYEKIEIKKLKLF